MKKIVVLFLLLLTPLLAACDTTISESAMETAVSQVILTSSASDDAPDSVEQTQPQPETGSNEAVEELVAVKAALSEAEIQLTDQAGQITDLQSELDALYPLLTPTITPTPFNTPTPAATSTPPPRPTATVFSLPYYHKYVTPIDKAALFYYKDKNDSGYPLMLKTDPVVKFFSGDVFIVDINRVRADGGGYFYLIIGPKNTGNYVRYEDVEDYKE